jgi:hypothetical protein
MYVGGECILGHWHLTDEQPQTFPFAMPGDWTTSGEYVRSAQWSCIEEFEALGLDILVTGLFGWELQRAYIPKSRTNFDSPMVQIWPN